MCAEPPSGKTEMRYQVEGFGVVQDSRCTSLRQAQCIRDILITKGCNDARIARYAVSEHSDYYEIVE